MNHFQGDANARSFTRLPGKARPLKGPRWTEMTSGINAGVPKTDSCNSGADVTGWVTPEAERPQPAFTYRMCPIKAQEVGRSALACGGKPHQAAAHGPTVPFGTVIYS
jgi:hypothetical protein